MIANEVVRFVKRIIESLFSAFTRLEERPRRSLFVEMILFRVYPNPRGVHQLFRGGANGIDVVSCIDANAIFLD